MKRFFYITAFIICATAAYSQQLNPKYDRDSLFNALVTKLPEARQREFKEGYIAENIQGKEFYILMLNMPHSSKDEMTANIGRKKPQIATLIKNYTELVPKGYTVYIEFEPEDKIFQMPASIDLHIYGDKKTDDSSGYNLVYGSADLKKSLDRLGWTVQTLEKIKTLLDAAGCISIENGADKTEIGFARSGMGKYGFLVFPKVLNNKEITEYNDGCHYIYHENNLVLTYGGGAVGPDCFPD